MSLQYDKITNNNKSTDSMWASYSDLFMMLSVVFLLLYVTANLRSGTSGLQNRIEYQRLVVENEDLKQQNRVYEALKNDYLAAEATKSEVDTYKQLMDKLSLLQSQAKEEKNDLRRQATENEKKEQALNHYQQIIRNIINANLVAKSKIASRDEVIEIKKQTITEKDTVIESQSQEMQSLQAEINKNQSEITKAKAELEQKMKDVIASRKAAKITKAKMNKTLAALKAESEAKVQKLQEAFAEAREKLAAATAELASTQSKVEQTSKQLAEVSAEKETLAGEFEEAKKAHGDAVEKLKSDYEGEMAAKKKAFDDEMAKEKLSGAQKAAREKAFREQAEKGAAELGAKIAALDSKVKESEKNLAATASERDKYKEYMEGLKKQNEGLSGDLKKARDQIETRRNVAKEIKNALKKAGIKADVDGNTGDVVLSFDEYFDTGKADLKPKMEEVLKKFVPQYSKTLFKNPDLAKKISSVDLVGFASPTYRGKYVDPQSLKEKDREAVTYNLDLSYQRAKSIFTYIFDTQKMKYENQDKLLGVVKVTGRSFLHEGVKGRGLESGIPRAEFCKKNDCMKEQKVIIKFNLKE